MPEAKQTEREALAKFLQQPTIKTWHDGVATDLKESTRNQYLTFLMRYLGTEDPADFLKRAQDNPRELAIQIKSRLGEIYKHSMIAAHISKYSLRSFLDFYEVDLQLKGKVKVKRTRKKSELPWQDADSIILETDEPYRSLFRFMKWSGLGEDEVMEIQRSVSIQHAIETQRGNDKPYIRIDLSPRKSTLDEFFTLAPKQHVPDFPLKTKKHKDRGGVLVDPHDMQQVWRRAAKKAKLWQEGLGPHTLRSTFRSQCAKLGVADAVAEFCMGHGGGDKYGYSREVLNEQHVASQLEKLWAGQIGAIDPLTSGEIKFNEILKVTHDPKMISEIMQQRMSPAEVEAVITFHRQLEQAKPQQIRERIINTRDLIRIKSREWVEEAAPGTSAIIVEHEAPPRASKHVKRRTQHNGGSPLQESDDDPRNDPPDPPSKNIARFETKIIEEAQLVECLDAGYDFLRELSNGKIIVRRNLT